MKRVMSNSRQLECITTKGGTMWDHLTLEQLNDRIVEGEIDPLSLPREQFAAWAAWEPDPVPMNSFVLADENHRQAFLFQYCWQGEPALFAAVAHIWDSLAEPREARCIQIGLATGTGGKGKIALMLMLQKLLAECLDYPPQPRPDAFDSLEAWHQASMQAFAAEEQRERELYVRYSAILNGSSPAPNTAADATVVTGPWTDSGWVPEAC